MKRRSAIGRAIGAILAGLAIGTGLAQDPVQFQHRTNPPRCPLCRTEVTSQPLTLMVADDAQTFSGAGLLYGALVCPKDGLIFCVQE